MTGFSRLVLAPVRQLRAKASNSALAGTEFQRNVEDAARVDDAPVAFRAVRDEHVLFIDQETDKLVADILGPPNARSF